MGAVGGGLGLLVVICCVWCSGRFGGYSFLGFWVARVVGRFRVGFRVVWWSFLPDFGFLGGLAACVGLL